MNADKIQILKRKNKKNDEHGLVYEKPKLGE